MTKRKLQYWVIPPDADPEFIASMENILDTYEEPYDPDYPKLCMDEQPVQLHKEIRRPIAATKNHARRIDYEYDRCGTACVFMFTEPLSGWRQATVRPQRTKVDWALEMAALLDTRYKQARKVILVCDNLNTHTAGGVLRSLSGGEGPGVCETDRISLHAEARQLAQRRRERVEQHDPAVRLWSSFRDDPGARARDPALVRPFQQEATRRRLAIHSPRRPKETEIPLPQNQMLTEQ